MNKELVKRNTEAHGWLGLIISSLLFVVFFTGAISFFREEVQLWATSAHIKSTLLEGQEILPVSQILEIAITGRDFNAREHLTIYPPTHYESYYTAYVDLVDRGEGEKVDALLIHPVSGEIIGDPNDFSLASFLYSVHYSLNIPFGSYLIGFVALFFLFSIFSGVLIHAADFVKGFFRYRADGRKRSQLLDLHNIIGIISLPYTLMFAVTGLIFNLIIIYQIAFGVILYRGDIDALLIDAGLVTVAPEWQDEPWSNPPVDELYQQSIDTWGNVPFQMRVYNYGDSSAVLEFYGLVEDEFAGQFGVAYNVSDRSEVFSDNRDDPNAVSAGLDVVAALHYGRFGGLGLRLVYFILAMAVCALIVTGNLLWVGAREKTMSSAKLNFVGRFTLASTAGVAIATIFAFIAERLLPIGGYDRAAYLSYAFVIPLVTASSYIWLAADRRKVLVRLLQIVTGACFFLLLLDLTLYSSNLLQYFENGFFAPIGVDIGILASAILSAYASMKLQDRLSSIHNEKNNNSTPEFLENVG
jgi:uncharacterized iron-regulated membrane protein